MLISEISQAPGGGTYAYHGTTSDFTSFKVNDAEYMIDRALGVHFAADPEVSNSFIENRINGRLDGSKEGGRIVRVILPAGKFLQVPQRRYESGATETDQRAVEIMACYEAYRQLPELLMNYLVQARQIPANEAATLAHDMALGETVSIPHDKSYTLGSFLSNYGGKPFNADDRTQVVRMSRSVWRQQGYVGLRYINTSPMEMATASDPTSYIVFPDETGNVPVKVA